MVFFTGNPQDAVETSFTATTAGKARHYKLCGPRIILPENVANLPRGGTDKPGRGRAPSAGLGPSYSAPAGARRCGLSRWLANIFAIRRAKKPEMSSTMVKIAGM